MGKPKFLVPLSKPIIYITLELMECGFIVAEEVDKLLQVGFIREVQYLDWLANGVIVKKMKGKWRML